MRFASPDYFFLLLCIPLLIGFFIWVYQQKRAGLARFAPLNLIQKLTPDTGVNRQILKWILFLAFFFFGIVALVRPQFGVKMEMIERKGVDVMIAIDVSNSMLAEDVAPSRIERAKYEINKFIDLLKGDRVGIIVFAGESFVQCPLTLDYAAAKMLLDVVTTDWIQLQGTALKDAVEQAVKSFKSQDKKDRVLLVISDGEDHEGDPEKAAREAAKEGVRIYTVGIGSESGVPIPLKRQGENVVYKKDQAGNLVMSKLNSLILEKMAIEGRGKYFHAGTNLDLSQIYGEIDRMEKKDLGMNKMAVLEERYQIFLGMAIVLLLIEFFIPDIVRRKKAWRGRFE